MQSLPFNHNNVKLSLIDIESLPHHKKKSAREWSSACPVCQGEDRFLFWPEDGNFWCRQCELSGWVDQQAKSTLTEDQKADLEKRQRQARQAEVERQKSALELLRSRRPDIIYHKNLNGKTGYIKQKWGLDDDIIDLFKVGYCHCCPTSTYSDSITIPYYYQGGLVNLRHRLSSPNGSGKYRPEMAGLPSAIFNADIIKDEDWLVLVEGEFKAMVLWQNGLPAIGIPGAKIFKEKWLKLFSPAQLVFIALDPGAEKAAINIGHMFNRHGTKAKVASFPVKPDDFFVLYGGNTGQFMDYLQNGRVI